MEKKIIVNGSQEYLLKDIDCVFCTQTPENEYCVAFICNNEQVYINKTRTDDLLDVWEDYRSVIEIFKASDLKTIELINPVVLINYDNIKTNNDQEKAITILREVKEKEKTKNKKQGKGENATETVVAYKRNKITKNCILHAVFESGLVLDTTPNQPCKFSRYLFDRAPKVDEKAKIKQSEIEAEKAIWESNAEQAKVEKEQRKQKIENIKKDLEKRIRKRRLIKIAHQVLEEERKKKTQSQSTTINCEDVSIEE